MIRLYHSARSVVGQIAACFRTQTQRRTKRQGLLSSLRSVEKQSVRALLLAFLILLVLSPFAVQGIAALSAKLHQQPVSSTYAERVLKLYRRLRPSFHRHRNNSSSRSAAMTATAFMLAAPTNAVVGSSSSSVISLSWTAPSGTVDHYQIERSQSLSGPFNVIATSVAASFDDSSVSNLNSYLYRVRAVDSFGVPSPTSNLAVGTAITFTDSQLQVGVTQIRAQHVYDLRTAINALRAVAGLSAASWTQATLDNTKTIKANDIQELRIQLGEALSSLNVSAPSYTDPTLGTGSGGTTIKKAHIEELRQAATRGSSNSSGPVDIDSGASTMARLDPTNRTGGGGDDPLSRNFNWSIPLVGLSGRAGLNLGLSLSYNSLVWTKSGSYISYDDDHGLPAPGFRLGFPVIQAPSFNSAAGKSVYLLIASDGSRVELRQVGASALYESVDSSHLLLDSGTMILRATDGTQMSYAWKGTDYECIEMKDRNGNYITVNYNANGRIDTILDTLARTIKFNYDAGDYLTEITQTWNVNGATQAHQWARFYYNTALTIQTNFTGLSVLGPQNGSSLKVLTQVTFADESHANFDYTSWGQVWKISNYAPDGHRLNYRSYNLPQTSATAQTDCPRFTERHDWAENWNQNAGGVEQEVITAFAVPTATSWTMPDGTQQTGTLAQVTQADGTYSKLYSHSSGWDKGITLLSETYGSSDPAQGAPVIKQRSVTSSFEQDNMGVGYMLNPRTLETHIFDFDANGQSQNHKRTRVSYSLFTFPDGTNCALPLDVFEYQADATTVLRRSRTQYKVDPNNAAALDPTYTDRHIIGLASEKTLSEVNPTTGAETLMSRIGFQYDEANSIVGNDAPVQHDNAHFAAGLVAGRANLTSTQRYDIAPGATQSVTSSVFYNVAGSPVRSVDPASHQVLISYTDAFSTDGSTTYTPHDAVGNVIVTLGYPTLMTDPDGYQVRMKYHYDFGAQTWKQTPLPNTIAILPGPAHTTTYDSVGRVQRVTNSVNAAYTRYVYSSSQTRVDTYSTVLDGASEQNGNEAHSFSVLDGGGRAIASASGNPGSSGGFSGQITYFDKSGRAVKSSNPTETSASGNPYSWSATGDDAIANGGFGWLYTQQDYDWKGRSIRTTNTDGTQKTSSYNGCGCAGGELVTLIDEMGRKQKAYSDVLGRATRTELYNWNSTVYSTTTNAYNARDQITRVRQYAGAAPLPEPDNEGTGYQTTTMDYDGYGRLWKKHIPQQQVDPNNSSSTDHSTYVYNSDDTIQSLTDARGAGATYSYNARHLVTSISYAAPAGIAPAPMVSNGYDAAGNRSSMAERDSQNVLIGSNTYQYDDLSRLINETRYFNALSNAPTNGNYTINYQYNLAGEMTNITDPFGAQVSYNRDQVGKVGSVTGSGFLNISSYASDIKYRAWGGQKSVTYGQGGTATQATTTYNVRMKPASYQHPGLREQFQYYADGRLQQLTDLDDRNQDIGLPDTARHFSRVQGYDQVGRVTGSVGTPYPNFPYNQSYSYDAFGNATFRGGFYYYQNYSSDGGTFLNNRRQDFNYDADGNVTHSPSYNYVGGSIVSFRDWTYDSAGRTSQVKETITANNSVSTYVTNNDGDGQPVTEFDPQYAPGKQYMVRSSVLGGKVLTRLDYQGNKWKSVFSIDEQLTVVQWGINFAFQFESMQWSLKDPLGLSEAGETKAVYDPMGNHVSWQHVPTGPVNYQPSAASSGGLGPHFGYSINSSCILDGIPTDCSLALSMVGHGSAEQCPDNYCGASRARNGDLVPLTRDPDTGLLGYFSTTQNFPPGTRQEYKKPIRDAVAAAKKRIRDNPKCAMLFALPFLSAAEGEDQGEDNFGYEPQEGPSLEQMSNFAANLLENTTYRVLPLGQPYIAPNGRPAVTGAATVSWDTVFINSSGPFFNYNMTVSGFGPTKFDFGTGLDQTQFGALLLLHELGHQVGLFGSDAQDLSRNYSHTQAIIDNCFPELAQAQGRP